MTDSAPITLFLDIDGVINLFASAGHIAAIGSDPDAYPAPAARPFIRALDQHPLITPLWLSSWEEEAAAWNTWAGTPAWLNLYPPPANVWGQYQEQRHQRPFGVEYEKDLAVRAYAAAHPDRALVWIEDGFDRRARQWMLQEPRVLLLDTVPDRYRGEDSAPSTFPLTVMPVLLAEHDPEERIGAFLATLVHFCQRAAVREPPDS